MEKVLLINSMKNVGIILVVIGHSMPPLAYIEIPSIAIFAKTWIYSFHMPLFIFISGFVFSNFYKDKLYYSFIKRKAIKLLVPYVFFISFSTISKSVLSIFAINPISLNVEVVIYHLLFPAYGVIGHYWFLVILFCIFIFYPIYKNINDISLRYIFFLSFSLVSLNIINPLQHVEFLSLNRLCDLFVYFWFGCVAFRYYDLIYRNMTGKYLFLYSVILLLMGNFIEINNKIIMLFNAVMGIVMVWSFCVIYERNNWNFFNLLNGKTYSIYLLSGIVQMIIGTILKTIGLGFTIYFFSCIVTGILLPILMVKFSENFIFKFNFLKILLGK